MPRSARRNKPPQQGAGGWSRLQAPSGRALLCCLLAALLLWVMMGVFLSGEDKAGHVDPVARDRLSHKASKSSSAQIHRLASQVDATRLWETYLRPILIERLPGTAGSLAVQQHIVSSLSSLSAGWDLDLDSFHSPTPRGKVKFTNIIATLDPSAPRRLLLACHYDSKALPPDPRAPGRVFLGASDSAVPCAMILELVTALDGQLRELKQQKPAVSLQLVFFDGEEAFEEWTTTDSLYGSRHLAERMGNTPHPAGSAFGSTLQAVDLFVLLDLLGAPDPLIANHFTKTERWFNRLISAEKKLHRQGLLRSHPFEQTYFRKDMYIGPVQDDHIPFLNRGVPVLHIITTPFPAFWHTLQDTEDNMHQPTVENLTKILAVFLAEYLGL